MEPIVLTDKDQFPTEEIIFSHIGKAKTHWNSLFEYLHSDHPEFAEEWRYYNDGKSWLMKIAYKSKTVCWLSVIKGAFRLGFYFTDKAEGTIIQSRLSDEMKKDFIEGKHYGKLRAIAVIIKYKQDLSYAKELIDIKLKFLK